MLYCYLLWIKYINGFFMILYNGNYCHIQETKTWLN